MKWLIADWDGNKGHVYDGVIQGLSALGHSHQSISRSDMDQRPRLLEAIRGGEFDALLTWQRFYGMQDDLLAAVKESGIKTVFMDYGFRPHYDSVVFDSVGENAASSWPDFWSDGGPADLRQEDLDTADELIQSVASRLRKAKCPPTDGIDRLRFPFVFVPLQRPEDAVVKYDSSVNDFGAMFRRVLMLARGNQFVVCKTHPLDQNLELGVPERVDGNHLVLRSNSGRMNELICDYLLTNASLVVGVNSNMLFRATLYGTPVIALGSGWYSGSGVVHEVAGLEQLNSLLVPPPDIDLQVRYIATCLSRQLHFEELSDPARLSRVLERLDVLSPKEVTA